MKKRNLLIIGILILISLAFNVEAGTGENLGRWLDDHLFEPSGRLLDRDIRGLSGVPFYDDYAQLIDFAIFLILFVAITSIALNKAFKGESYKEARNAVKALSIIIGIALALAALKAGLSVTFFIPFVSNALFFIAIIVVYFLLLRMGMDKHKILAFILAIIITYLLFNLAGIAMEGGRIGIGEGKGIRGIELPKLPTAGIRNIGLLGKDCDDIVENRRNAEAELASLQTSIEGKKELYGIEEVTLDALWKRHTELKYSIGEGKTEEEIKKDKKIKDNIRAAIKKDYDRWKQLEGYIEKWKKQEKKCIEEGKISKTEDLGVKTADIPEVEKKKEEEKPPEEITKVPEKIELKAYKIIDVYNVNVVPTEDDKYRGGVKYKNIVSGEEHDVLYTFNRFGSLDDISKQWFAERLNLNQSSEEFKNLERDIKNLAMPKIAALKAKIEEKEVKKGLGTGAKIGIGGGLGLALLVAIVFFLKRRKGEEAEGKAKDVEKETEKMRDKLTKLPGLMQEKREKIVSLDKNAEGGFIKNA